MAFEHFLKLPMADQERIRQASLAEFLAHGYDLASTNRMVERAGISKGVLFKYFAGKEALFLYLCQCSAEVVAAGYDELLPRLPDDFWACLKEMTLHELTMREHRQADYGLMEMVMADPQHPVYRQAVALFAAKGAAVYARLMATVSQSGLRQDVPFAQVLQVIRWVAEGMKQQYRGASTVDRQAVMTDLESYLNLLKTGLQA